MFNGHYHKETLGPYYRCCPCSTPFQHAPICALLCACHARMYTDIVSPELHEVVPTVGLQPLIHTKTQKNTRYPLAPSDREPHGGRTQ